MVTTSRSFCAAALTLEPESLKLKIKSFIQGLFDSQKNKIIHQHDSLKARRHIKRGGVVRESGRNKYRFRRNRIVHAYFTRSVVIHPTKIGTVLIDDGNGCKTVSAFIPRPVLKDRRAILVSDVPSGTWVGVKKLPRGRGKGKGVGRRRLPHPSTISLGASLLGKLKPRWPQVTVSV